MSKKQVPTVGCVGMGFVGTAVVRGFSTFADISTYDIDPHRCANTLAETLNNQFVFVCLPTPMESPEGGDCDLSIVEGFFDEAHALILSETHAFSHDPIFILKSTVPIGTTQTLNNKYIDDIVIVHNPEFLTARCSLIDFITPARNVVGGDCDSAVFEVAELMRDRFPGIPCFEMTSQESEFVKYMANCFFATKVTFFNEMKLLSDRMEMNWDQVLEGVLADGRIAKSHYQVPGHDGQMGYGGTCFPKDINALIKTMEKEGLDPMLLKASWEQNKEVRDDWDWARSKSAVSSPIEAEQNKEEITL